MKEIEVLPTEYPLPQKAKSVLTGEECIIYGRPCKKISTALHIIDAHGNSIPGSVSVWVEEGSSDSFIDMLVQLSLITK